MAPVGITDVRNINCRVYVAALCGMHKATVADKCEQVRSAGL
jgi:hypothetical protein